MAALAGGSVQRIRAERNFYIAMAGAMLVTIFIGFAPTYFLRGAIDLGHPLTPLTPLVHVHGILFSSWVVLFIVQVALVRVGRASIHRKLGVAGLVLALALIATGTAVALYGLHRPTAPPGISALSWLAVPLLSVPAFGILILVGFARRNIAQTHKRLMLIAVINMLPPATGRMPWPDFMTGPLSIFVVPDLLFFVPLILWDMKTRGRVHPATLWGGLLTVALQITTFAVWQTGPWLRFAAWAASLTA